jgi:hypothetical protein
MHLTSSRSRSRATKGSGRRAVTNTTTESSAPICPFAASAARADGGNQHRKIEHAGARGLPARDAGGAIDMHPLPECHAAPCWRLTPTHGDPELTRSVGGAQPGPAMR